MKRTVMLHWLVGIILVIAASAAGAWTSNELSNRPSHVLVAPEANTMSGFGAALVLNGLGVAGTGYYLRRRYNRDSAKRYADRNVARLPLFLDTAFSIAVVLLVSPVLIAVATAGALVTGSPKVYGGTKLVTDSNNQDTAGVEVE